MKLTRNVLAVALVLAGGSSAFAIETDNIEMGFTDSYSQLTFQNELTNPITLLACADRTSPMSGKVCTSKKSAKASAAMYAIGSLSKEGFPVPVKLKPTDLSEEALQQAALMSCSSGLENTKGQQSILLSAGATGTMELSNPFVAYHYYVYQGSLPKGVSCDSPYGSMAKRSKKASENGGQATNPVAAQFAIKPRANVVQILSDGTVSYNYFPAEYNARVQNNSASGYSDLTAKLVYTHSNNAAVTSDGCVSISSFNKGIAEESLPIGSDSSNYISAKDFDKKGYGIGLYAQSGCGTSKGYQILPYVLPINTVIIKSLPTTGDKVINANNLKSKKSSIAGKIESKNTFQNKVSGGSR